MPRRKLAEKRLPRSSRTRTGCNSCRQRKVKCDEQKPTCQQCQRQNLTCFSGVILKWQADFKVKGQAFGRQGVWSKPKNQHSISRSDTIPSELPFTATSWCITPSIDSHHFINTHQHDWGDEHVKDAEYQLVGSQECTHFFMQSISAVSSPPQTPHIRTCASTSSFKTCAIQKALSPTPQSRNIHINASILLQHFVQRICPLTTPTGSPNSPFATIILPYSLSASPAVFQSLLALAACSKCTVDHSWNETAIRIKARVLKFLRKRLDSRSSTEVAEDPEVLIITMIMCLYEIINKCDERWVVYLRGAKDIIRIRKELPPKVGSMALAPVFAFAERFFAYQDIIGRTACGVDPIFPSTYWRTTGKNIDSWMGCSSELIEILSFITELSRMKQQNTAAYSDPTFIARAASLEARLEGLVQIADDVEDNMLYEIAEAKRLAVTLYLYCTLYDASPSTQIVVNLVRDILARVTSCLDAGYGSSLTWPLFMAAVELDPLVEELVLDSGYTVSGRKLVLDTILSLSTSTVANLGRTRAVITKIWHSRDESEIRETTSNLPLSPVWNDWQAHVAPFSMYLSLV